MAEERTMDVDHRFDRWTDHSTPDRLPLGTVACGRGLRRTGFTRRDLAREYDDWMDRSFERRRAANEREPP
jgi:hypothetical protein